MLKYHATLIDPSPGEVVEMLTDAAAGANKRCRARKLVDKPAAWRKFAREVGDAPEGWRMWRGGRGGVPASQVVGAWWSDPVGRKHVVVRGRRVEDYAARFLLSGDELAGRCPLWHAYPEYVYRRTIGKTTEWVCACGCGAVGTPAALGWMGRSCGPCFDREQELGPAALKENRPGVLYGERGPMAQVTASPGGRWVAAIEESKTVCVWDTAARTRREFRPDKDMYPYSLAFTAGGTLLGSAVSGGTRRFFRCDPAADPIAVQTVGQFVTLRIHPLRDPALAVVQRTASLATRLEILRTATGEAVRSFALPPDIAGLFAVSPDEKLVALVGSGRILVLDLVTFARVADMNIGGNANALAFGPTRLFAGLGVDVLSFDPTTWKRAEVERHAGSVPGAGVLWLGLSPDGADLFAGDTGGRLTVYDPATLRVRAAFDWHIGAVTGLAVDGDVVYTSGSDGAVKVWPIRQLLTV